MINDAGQWQHPMPVPLTLPLPGSTTVVPGSTVILLRTSGFELAG